MKTTTNSTNRPGRPLSHPLKALVPLLAIGTLASCGTQSVGISHSSTQPAGAVAGIALINAIPNSENRDRIKGTKVIAVNGRTATRKKATVASGTNVVTIRFDWPQGGAQEVGLKFRARADQKYYVKYAPFPPTADQTRGTTEVSNAASVIRGAAFDVMRSGGGNPLGAVAGTVVLAPAIPLGAVELGYRIKETIREENQPAQYVDVYVLSEDVSEGMVRRVRVYPDGRLLSENFWDNYHYTPGYHYRESRRPLGSERSRELRPYRY